MTPIEQQLAEVGDMVDLEGFDKPEAAKMPAHTG